MTLRIIFVFLTSYLLTSFLVTICGINNIWFLSYYGFLYVYFADAIMDTLGFPK